MKLKQLLFEEMKDRLTKPPPHKAGRKALKLFMIEHNLKFHWWTFNTTMRRKLLKERGID